MKVKDLIAVLLDCNQDLDVINVHYQDCYSVKEETVRNVRNNGEKTAASHVILEFSEA
jgi:hypothetical protein